MLFFCPVQIQISNDYLIFNPFQPLSFRFQWMENFSCINKNSPVLWWVKRSTLWNPHSISINWCPQYPRMHPKVDQQSIPCHKNYSCVQKKSLQLPDSQNYGNLTATYNIASTQSIAICNGFNLLQHNQQIIHWDTIRSSTQQFPVQELNIENIRQCSRSTLGYNVLRSSS